MTTLPFNLCALLAALACAPLAFAATVFTADTTVRLQATDRDDASITLTSLTGSDGAAWIPAPAPSLTLIRTATVAGKTVPLQWHLAPSRDDTENPVSQHVFDFTCNDPSLELASTWSGTAKGEGGPIEHALAITNHSTREVLLPLQSTLAFEAVIPPGAAGLENWWIEKGAGSPSAQGVHRTTIAPGFSVLLDSTACGSSGPREPIPWAAVHDPGARRGFYLGVESSGHVRIALTRREAAGGGVLRIDAGLTPDPGYGTRLAPGETLHLPAVFVGCYRGDVDDGCNRLRRWVKSHLLPTCSDARYPLLVNNSWGSGMAINDALARRMIDDSADLGLELFHIDAGWFRGVGDWYPDPAKFPGGLACIADYAHAKGLKFGLWVGWTQGGDQRGGSGDDRPLSVYDETRRDWFPQDPPAGWKTPGPFTGWTVCLADPPAADWCLAQLRRIVKDYKLDMLEHDQQMIVDACTRTDHSHTSSPADVALRASQAYYRIYDTLRRENPDLLLEDCVNGGRMVDFGVLRRANYLSITDTYDPLSNRRAFWDASYVLPPSACECYIEDHHPKTLASFIAMLRSGMMGWCTIMMDTSAWTAAQRAAAKQQFALYKAVLRPLILNADLYHISERPDGVNWDAIEYWDTKTGNGAVYVFRGTTAEAEHRFLLRGLDASAAYEVRSQDASLQATELTGAVLQNTGITPHLAEPESSDIIFLHRR